MSIFLQNEHTLDPLLVTEREAARMLGISQRTLFTLRKRGELVCVRVGGSVRYAVDDLKTYIYANRQSGVGRLNCG